MAEDALWMTLCMAPDKGTGIGDLMRATGMTWSTIYRHLRECVRTGRSVQVNIPAGIRNAVIQRDRRCPWAGGCNQPAAACEVHHVKHKANGGKTSTKQCVLLCSFHHQIVIHRWGWTLVLNPDGTTTAWNPDRTKVLHSHGPRPAPGERPGLASTARSGNRGHDRARGLRTPGPPWPSQGLTSLADAFRRYG